MAADVLVVDDEADIRDLVAGILADEGYAVRTANDSESALAAVRARKPSLLILDIWMQGGGMDGMELLDLVKRLDADLPVIMISGHGNIETAVSAIKKGAYDFIEKPFKADRLVLVADKALENSRLRREVKELTTRSLQSSKIVGHSPALTVTEGEVEVADVRLLTDTHSPTVLVSGGNTTAAAATPASQLRRVQDATQGRPALAWPAS